MDDIIDSLRECAAFDWIEGSFSSATMREAADEIARLRKALKPFAACVFNDNGAMTVSSGDVRMYECCIAAYFAMRPRSECEAALAELRAHWAAKTALP